MKGNGVLFIRAASLFGLELLQRRGTAPLSELMKQVGNPIEALKNPDQYLNFINNIKLIELAAQEWHRPNLGLEWTLSLPKSFPNVGPLLLISRFTNNTYQWIEAAIEYGKVHTNAFEIALLRESEISRVLLSFNTFSWPGRHIIEHSIANICFGMRIVFGNPELNPIEVQFTHSKPQTPYYDELLSKMFKCEVKFNCEENQLLYPTKLFENSTSKSLGLFRSFMRANIQKRMEQMGSVNANIASNVEQAIRILMGIRQVKFENVAELLDVAPKTLQRMLQAEGESFTNILDGVRRNDSIEMLTRTNLSVSQIAKNLDYSSNPSFTLAFKRWEGMSPAQYRSKNRAFKLK